MSVIFSLKKTVNILSVSFESLISETKIVKRGHNKSGNVYSTCFHARLSSLEKQIFHNFLKV